MFSSNNFLYYFAQIFTFSYSLPFVAMNRISQLCFTENFSRKKIESKSSKYPNIKVLKGNAQFIFLCNTQKSSVNPFGTKGTPMSSKSNDSYLSTKGYEENYFWIIIIYIIPKF